VNASDPKFMPLPTWLYVLGWGVFLYVFIQILNFSAAPDNSNHILTMGMYFINLGVHEAAHFATFFLPPIIVSSAGSIAEIIFALLLLLAAFKGKSYFAAVFTGLWVMFSFISAGIYMSDARAQVLPLIGPGESLMHDWYYVFSQLGWLNADTLIGGSMRTIGITVGATSLAFGAYLIILKVSRHKLTAKGLS
jgi:hypothetical protein